MAVTPKISKNDRLPSRVWVKDAEVEHWTCVNHSQGLMCKASDRDRQPVINVRGASVVTSEQLGQISNALLAVLYVVLPAGLGLAVFLRDLEIRSY